MFIQVFLLYFLLYQDHKTLMRLNISVFVLAFASAFSFSFFSIS